MTAIPDWKWGPPKDIPTGDPTQPKSKGGLLDSAIPPKTLISKKKKKKKTSKTFWEQSLLESGLHMGSLIPKTIWGYATNDPTGVIDWLETTGELTGRFETFEEGSKVLTDYDPVTGPTYRETTKKTYKKGTGLLPDLDIGLPDIDLLGPVKDVLGKLGTGALIVGAAIVGVILLTRKN